MSAPDPQTADDAAERLQAWLDGDRPILPVGAIRELLRERTALLTDRARTATELERMRRERAADNDRTGHLIGLLSDLTDSDPCWFDHHGGRQAHGFLGLENSEQCPHALAKAFLAGAQAHRAAETAATRPADGLTGTSEGPTLSTPVREAQQGAESDGGGRG